jgi:hypothetical protein
MPPLSPGCPWYLNTENIVDEHITFLDTLTNTFGIISVIKLPGLALNVLHLVQGLGNLAFAYSFSFILIEIQVRATSGALDTKLLLLANGIWLLTNSNILSSMVSLPACASSCA